ncbi:MAG: guanylate kinase [Planctomycetes bacterium]|nr:guanylate kinase [Planctomycetota bacterium]
MSAREPHRLIVLTGPSGAGKSSIIARLKSDPHVYFSVSATTRAPRAGERDGVDYWFYDEERFAREVEQGLFLEHALVHGKRYGTPRRPIEQALASGSYALLDIDVQGAEQLRDQRVDGTYILLVPPSLAELRRRLEARGTESKEQLERRLARAERELERRDLFDHIVTNDVLARAAAEIKHLIGLEDARGADGCGG